MVTNVSPFPPVYTVDIFHIFFFHFLKQRRVSWNNCDPEVVECPDCRTNNSSDEYGCFSCEPTTRADVKRVCSCGGSWSEPSSWNDVTPAVKYRLVGGHRWIWTIPCLRESYLKKSFDLYTTNLSTVGRKQFSVLLDDAWFMPRSLLRHEPICFLRSLFVKRTGLVCKIHGLFIGNRRIFRSL